MSYEAKFLNDEEFDALPYPETDVSLGIADPETRMAYVRRSGVPVVDAFRLAHELEHLDEHGQGIYSDHFKNGVYYKRNSWIAPAAGGLAAIFAPAMLPALLGSGVAAGGAGSALFSVLPALLGSGIAAGGAGSALSPFGVAPLSGSMAATGGLSPRSLLGLPRRSSIVSLVEKVLSGAQPAQGEQTGRLGQQPASVIQSGSGFGMGPGSPGAVGFGPDLMKNIRESMSGIQAGRNPVMDLYRAPNSERGFGMNQGETF